MIDKEKDNMKDYRQAKQDEYDLIIDQALTRLHPSLCIWCGTDFGLKYRYASDLTTWPDHYYIDLAEVGKDGLGPEGVWIPCGVCRQRKPLPTGLLAVRLKC